MNSKIIFGGLIAALLLLTGAASAYVFTFEAPSTIESGEELVFDGSGTMPAGFTTEMTIYMKGQVANKVVGKYPITVQDDGKWAVKIDTHGWQANIYTVEIPKSKDYSFSGTSKTAHTFTVTGSSEIPAESLTETETEAVQTQTPSSEQTVSPVPASPEQTQKSPAGIITLLTALGAAFLIKKE